MLLSSTQKLQIALDGAVTTAELPLVAGWADMLDDASTLSPASATSITTGTTAVDLVPAPAAGSKRQIKYLSAYNADSASATVTVRVDDAGTARILAVVTLAAGSRLEYAGDGFRVFDASGALLGIGTPGLDGDDGNAATVTVGSTTTGAAGTSAAVTNSGTSAAAVLEFTIPEGDPGDDGEAATIAVGTVTTGSAGTSATVTNSGTPAAAVLDFTIPRGETGPLNLPPVVTEAGAALTATGADSGNYTRFTSATAKAYTFDSAQAYATNAEYHGRNAGAGDLTLTAAGTFVLNPPADGSLVIPEGGTFTVKIVGAAEADVFGVTEAP